jgi:hypothetical protein
MVYNVDQIFGDARRNYESSARAQAEIIRWARIREQARDRQDSSLADDAHRHINSIYLPDPQFWANLREVARLKQDTRLADLARQRANNPDPKGYWSR